MFGLMKTCGYGSDAAQRETRRLHYCGTCKTMGRLYGQETRFLLNYDAVFLGELLTALLPQPTPFAPAYISRNCLTLPAASQLPLPLQYAATANVLLTEFKLIDHIADTQSRTARATQFLFSRAFRKAHKRLAAWRFPLRELYATLRSQTARERASNLTFDHVAHPTAMSTRLIFQQGAILIAARDETVRAMAEIGDLFGRIVYLIDALQDGEKDAQSGGFNALAATATTVADARLQLGRYQSALTARLRTLPMDAAQTRLFVSRLNHNLAPLLTAQDNPQTDPQTNPSDDRVEVVSGNDTKKVRRARFCNCCADICGEGCGEGCTCCCESSECCKGCCEVVNCCDSCN